jgi:hypothetical protein
MAEGSRLPQAIDAFNGYINTTGAYLEAGSPTTNASRLGITEQEVIQWKSFGTAWNPLYSLYVDKKSSRTTSIKDQLWEIINQTVAFNQTNHILDRISVSLNVTIVDMETFNIKKGVLRKSTRTIPQTPISEPITVTIQPIGGGSISIKCYSSTGQRASIYKNADSVQYLYQVGTTPPASAEDNGLSTGISSKAIFMLSLGTASSSKFLYIYFRWYNVKHPELSSPWSSLQTTLIL